jgi:hypothetical protein
MTGMAFLNNILYGVRNTNNLYTIDTSNGAASNEKPLFGLDGSIEGLASDGSSLYGCDDVGHVYTIDPASGNCTDVGQPIAGELSGLSFNPTPITPGEGNIICTDPTPGPPVWPYSLTHVTGSIGEWRLSANEITDANAPAGWSVFALTLNQVIFKKDGGPMTSGTVNGFEVMGNANQVVDWRVHSSTGNVPGPAYSLPFNPAGTPVNFPDDETPATGSPIPLGFSFPFFGSNYTDVYINPNGHLTLGAPPGNDDWRNLPFPHNIPRIAPCWDDLDPTVGGTVTYNATNNVFVVSYIDVPLWSSHETTNTFQVALFGDSNPYGKPPGAIAFGYSDLNGVDNDSATVGINSGDGRYEAFPEVGENGIATEDELGAYFLKNKNFSFTPDSPYETCEMGDDLSEKKSAVQLLGAEPGGIPGSPKTWTYKLIRQSGDLSQWMYRGSEITDAAVSGDALAAGWSVAEKTDNRVIFIAQPDEPLTSGELGGFEIVGNSTSTDGEWISHGKSGDIPGPQLSLPIDPNLVGTLPVAFLLDYRNSHSNRINFGFNFPFFGELQNGVYVSTNGNLWFNLDDDDDENVMLGVEDDAVGRIASFWDNLDPSTLTGGGEVSYYRNPGAGLFAVTYLSVPVYRGNNNTFQIILFGPNNDYGFENGTIALCYGPLNDVYGTAPPTDIATIGLDKGDATNFAAIGPPTTSSRGLVYERDLEDIWNRNFIFHWDAQKEEYNVEETLSDLLHGVIITNGPNADPNPAESGGLVQLSVTALDSQGHPVDYSWTVSPDEGAFGDAEQQNPQWTAPVNNTGSDKVYTMTVTASCRINPNVKTEGSVEVTVKSSEGCFADVNGDRQVDIVDIQLVAGAFGAAIGNPKYNPDYDVNCDDNIDIDDIQFVAGKWGTDSDDPDWLDCPTSLCAPVLASASISLTFPGGTSGALSTSKVVQLQIRDAVDVGAVQFRFHPQEGLMVKNIIAGDFLGRTGNTVIPLRSEDADSGEITFGLISFGKAPSANGNGVLAQIELEVQSNGEYGRHMCRPYSVLSDVKLTNKKGNPLSSNLQSIRFSILPPPPKVSALLANYPNPFNPETWIPYQLSEAAKTVISIYDVSGRLVRKFDLGYKEAGFHLNKSSAVYWDGANDLGEAVASGVYFYHLKSGNNFTAIRKMLIVK